MKVLVDILGKKNKLDRQELMEKDEVPSFIKNFNYKTGERIGKIVDISSGDKSSEYEIIKKDELTEIKRKSEEVDSLRNELRNKRAEAQKAKEQRRKEKEAEKERKRREEEERRKPKESNHSRGRYYC